MNACIVLLCLIVHVFCNNEKQETLGEAVETAAVATGHPEIAAAIEILKSARSETSSTISERYDQAGFKKLHNIYDHSYGAIYSNKLDQQIKLWLDDGIFNFLTLHHKNILSNAIKEYSLQIFDEVYHKKKFELSFNDGKGSLFLLVLTISPHPTKSDAIKWEKYILFSEFEPAPSYVIVTESDCNLLSCDRSDQIVYLPVMITDTHVRSIIDLNINLINNMQTNLIADK